MNTIWKFELNPGEQEIRLPADSKFLCVQVQHGMPCLWVQVLVPAKTGLVELQTRKPWKIFVRGTGWQFDPGPAEYVGTFQLDGGSLVFHVFAEKVS